MKTVESGNLKNIIMDNLLYIAASIFIVLWGIGLFAYSVGGTIHIFLLLALISVLIRIVKIEYNKSIFNK